MITSSITSETSATAQLMLLQNRAHHEERLQQTKSSIDNKLQDFSYLLKPKGKKQYLAQQKTKKIYEGNLNLLSKIHTITFDKHNEFASKYRVVPKQCKGEDSSQMVQHPFSNDHRSRSMNTSNRRKDLIKITKDNAHLLEKLKTMKPTVPNASEFQERKKQLAYLKQLTKKRDDAQPYRLLNSYIHEKSRGHSAVEKYLHKHELGNSRDYEQEDSSYFMYTDHNNSFDLQSKMIQRPRNSFDNNRGVKSPLLSMSVDHGHGVYENIHEGPRSGKHGQNKNVLLQPIAQHSRSNSRPDIEDINKGQAAYLKYGVGEIIKEEVNREGLKSQTKNVRNY